MFRVWVEEAILKYWLKVNNSLFEQEWHILTSIPKIAYCQNVIPLPLSFLAFSSFAWFDWLAAVLVLNKKTWHLPFSCCHLAIATYCRCNLLIATCCHHLATVAHFLPVAILHSHKSHLDCPFYNMLKLEKNIKIWRIGSNMAATSTPSFCCLAKKRWETK